ncbi:MAG: PqiC family protein [Methylomonas sp.]
MENKLLTRCSAYLIVRAFLLALPLAACSSAPPTRLYMLNAETVAATDGGRDFNPKLLVGLGPIHLPDYLNRPQIVIAESENRYRLDEHDRWAEQLGDNIGRALAQFLANRLPAEQVLRYPWPQRQLIDYQISIDIFQFHQTADKSSRLQAQWRINHREQTLVSRQFACEQAARDQAEDIVQAQSICLGRLGQEIESELRRLAD